VYDQSVANADLKAQVLDHLPAVWAPDGQASDCTPSLRSSIGTLDMARDSVFTSSKPVSRSQCGSVAGERVVGFAEERQRVVHAAKSGRGLLKIAQLDGTVKNRGAWTMIGKTFASWLTERLNDWNFTFRKINAQ